ncbi:MAG: neutral/alkaline non-lysosomal ceramidase N-terminal domain-containing protein [Bacteroidota bacterium]
MMKILKFTGLLLLLVFISAIVFVTYNWRDRHPDYNLDLLIIPEEEKSEIMVGASAQPITVDIVDTWNDVNSDAKFKPEDGDTYNDNNKNGKFDVYWIAGFDNKRAANGVHDDVWARTVVIDDGNSRIAIVSVDAIGFMIDDVIDVRKSIEKELNIDYCIIASTHTHESNDLIGIWGSGLTQSGVDEENMNYVKEQIKRSVKEAVESMQTAELHIAQDLVSGDKWVDDSRKPIVKDSGIRLIRAVNPDKGNTIATLMFWANHPETLWNKNLQISSDFPHYYREFVEDGIYKNDTLIKKGLGGIAIYFNGSVGGLMTTRPQNEIKDLVSDSIYDKAGFPKIEAQGRNLALVSLDALENPDTVLKRSNIKLRAKSILLPLENNTFKMASAIGLLRRGMSGYMKMKSEVAIMEIGPLSIVTIPGESYPELVNGGVAAPEGNDFNYTSVKHRSIREMMNGKYKVVIGLANDEIGYIIPKSQWDVEAPYAYERESSQYGEGNSFGPETAVIICREIEGIIDDLDKK